MISWAIKRKTVLISGQSARIMREQSRLRAFSICELRLGVFGRICGRPQTRLWSAGNQLSGRRAIGRYYHRGARSPHCLNVVRPRARVYFISSVHRITNNIVYVELRLVVFFFFFH